MDILPPDLLQEIRRKPLFLLPGSRLGAGIRSHSQPPVLHLVRAGGHSQATYLCPAPQGEFMKPLGMQALACLGAVATSVGPPQAKARTPNGLCTAVNLRCPYPSRLTMIAGKRSLD
jgi:hypothetical protein